MPKSVAVELDSLLTKHITFHHAVHAYTYTHTVILIFNIYTYSMFHFHF